MREIAMMGFRPHPYLGATETKTVLLDAQDFRRYCTACNNGKEVEYGGRKWFVRKTEISLSERIPRYRADIIRWI